MPYSAHDLEEKSDRRCRGSAGVVSGQPGLARHEIGAASFGELDQPLGRAPRTGAVRTSSMLDPPVTSIDTWLAVGASSSNAYQTPPPYAAFGTIAFLGHANGVRSITLSCSI